VAEPLPLTVRRYRRARRLSTVLAVLLGSGCAPLPPVQAIADVQTIAGKWVGNIQFGRGPYELFYLTIDPDGSLVAWWGVTTRWGRVNLAERRPRFTLYVWSGDLDYLAGDGRRILILKEDFGAFYAQVTPYE
jgi:hypothetical protein